MKALLWCAVSSEEQADAEKASLPDQERTLRAAAARAGYSVIDTLTVPGMSRRFLSWDEFVREADSAGIDAPARMVDHWQRRDFDAVFVRDGSRFGRSQSLFSYFVERTVLDAGASVITLQDGEISTHNYRMFISMGGYAAAADVDGLVKKATIGKMRRAERGLSFGAFDPFTHILKRDALGRPIELVLDESKRRLWDDFLEVFCGDAEHPPTVWRLIERELYTRFGHADKLGRPYHVHKFHEIVFTPTFHGHTGFNLKTAESAVKSHHWLYDTSLPVPEGVTLYRNTIQPVYSGAQADRFYAELRRRRVMVGKRSPTNTYAFSALLCCGECGGAMVAMRPKPTLHYHYYYCWNRKVYSASERYSHCSNSKTIRSDHAATWFNSYLATVIASGTDDPFPALVQSVPQSRLNALEREIADCEGVLRGLVLQIATAPDSVAGILIEQRDIQGERLTTLRYAYRESAAQVERYTAASANRVSAFSALKSLGLDAFWALPQVEQNKMLHALLGGRRLSVLNGEIIGMAQ